MWFFQRLSPVRAVRDLRSFLIARQRHELVFLMLAVAITSFLIAGFVHDSRVERPYKREIIYAESWPLNRSDAEIRAQQAKDLPGELKAKADYERAVAERRAAFKRADDALENWGF